ncbi:efflux RND transporter periplasmic adaptor subunit [Thaumasiovibrio sp. DFM-14]|uniref:efflux RND transporter periplasmic adaptor subunit n=1 Tax=Thaumasiovibrio sp. DFM-14 TaxID=3384792 RepID=UPI00399FF505
MSTFKVASFALVVGIGVGVGANHIFSTPINALLSHGEHSLPTKTDTSGDKEPLYWVAPMDPNYQRDKPGKSPMGMDLIPVYADELEGSNNKPGTVKIDSAVENNLGVKTDVVTLEPLLPRIDTVGYISFDESQLWQTNVRVSGWVETLNINAIGEKVNKGDILFTLYSPELIKAQEELINAYKTNRTAMIKGATERLLTLGVDKEQINAITRRGKATQSIEIKAPESGVIASLNIREGGYLSPAQTAISAGSLRNIWVDAEVFERQAHWITPESKATMTLDTLPDQHWQGDVDYIYPVLDPKTRTLRVRLKFANPEGVLKPNMFANIALTPQSMTEVLTIPRSAVIRSNDMTRVVLAEGNGKYRSARINVGREAGDKIEVLQGLELGDRIVTSAHFLLDSESSLSADLSRINGVQQPAETAWASGDIIKVIQDKRVLTINHQPVPEWGWPGMVMDFSVADNIDIEPLTQGVKLEFEMRKTESGQYEITDYNESEQPVEIARWVTGNISTLLADFGMITLNHQPVAEWGWTSGVMNFSVEETVNLADFAEGQNVRFLIEKQGADYLLKALELNEEAL